MKKIIETTECQTITATPIVGMQCCGLPLNFQSALIEAIKNILHRQFWKSCIDHTKGKHCSMDANDNPRKAFYWSVYSLWAGKLTGNHGCTWWYWNDHNIILSANGKNLASYEYSQFKHIVISIWNEYKKSGQLAMF